MKIISLGFCYLFTLIVVFYWLQPFVGFGILKDQAWVIKVEITAMGERIKSSKMEKINYDSLAFNCT